MSKTVGIICSLDGYANSLKPFKIKNFLENHGFCVEIINTIRITNLLINIPIFVKIKILPFLFATIVLSVLNQFLFQFNFYRKNYYYYILIAQMKIRAKIIEEYLIYKNYYGIIIKTSYDSYVLTKKIKKTIKIFDCPTPWSFELLDIGLLNQPNFNKFFELEKKIYKKTDHLSFHWPSYRLFVEKHQYSGNNLFNLNSGCEPKPRSALAIYRKPLKIIYVGQLNGEWINLPLLSKLCKLYPYIDIYGGPTPPKNLLFHYKGYLRNMAILSDYQLGLITTSKDELRRSGFSAKHPEYISYGLPVLIPTWRRDPILNDSCIYYDEDNFLEHIKQYSTKKTWETKSLASVELAQKLSWEKTLEPLLGILG